MYTMPNPPVDTFAGITPASLSDAHWYAIYTRSRFEKKVHRDLEKSNFQVFLPLIKEKKKWSDRIKTVSVPLLPSYVFVKLDRQSIPRLNYYPGVVRLVTFDRKPCEVREEEIQLLEQITTHGMNVQQAMNCEIGDKVRITQGPLKGWEGNVEAKKGQSRIVFQIASILQCISVEVNMGDVELIR
ncbi:MAG: UpxY family transcription antiterminator [Saprospiraceae bacterium]|nr:UpxY family transcription antiterminator [Saprospiraceae bacterium]